MNSLKNSDEILGFLKKYPKLIFADDFEVAVSYENSQRRTYADGKPKERENFEGFWVGLRVIHRKRPGTAVTTDVTPQGLRTVVEQALHSAEQSSMDPWFRFPIWKPHAVSGSIVENGQYDSLAAYVSTLPLGFEERYQTRAIQTLLARKSEKYELRAYQNAHVGALSLLSSTAEDGARISETWAHQKDISDRGKRLERMSKTAALHAVLDTRRALVTDARDLVLAPHVASDWLMALSRPLSALVALRSGTFWDDLEKTPASSVFSLIDDGRAAEIPYGSQFDLEGSLTQRTTIFDKGERKAFLHDCYSAARDNRISTGNFQRRDLEMTPAIHPWHLQVEPGATSTPWNQSALVAFIDEVHPIPHASAQNSLHWDRMLSGVLMRRGEPVARIQPFRAHWAFAEMLQGITGMDNSAQMFGNVSCPSIWWEKMPKQSKEASL